MAEPQPGGQPTMEEPYGMRIWFDSAIALQQLLLLPCLLLHAAMWTGGKGQPSQTHVRRESQPQPTTDLEKGQGGREAIDYKNREVTMWEVYYTALFNILVFPLPLLLLMAIFKGLRPATLPWPYAMHLLTSHWILWPAWLVAFPLSFRVSVLMQMNMTRDTSQSLCLGDPGANTFAMLSGLLATSISWTLGTWIVIGLLLCMGLTFAYYTDHNMDVREKKQEERNKTRARNGRMQQGNQ